ncbi:hypothetical protein [Sinomonas atrocyanea]
MPGIADSGRAQTRPLPGSPMATLEAPSATCTPAGSDSMAPSLTSAGSIFCAADAPESSTTTVFSCWRTSNDGEAATTAPSSVFDAKLSRPTALRPLLVTHTPPSERSRLVWVKPG